MVNHVIGFRKGDHGAPLRLRDFPSWGWIPGGFWWPRKARERRRTGPRAAPAPGVRQPIPDGCAEFLMSDGKRRNAVDDTFVVRLNEAIDRAEERHDAALVIRSSLEGVFCSGADLTLPDAERALVSDRLYATYQRMLESPVIFVADVAGARGRWRPTVPRRRRLHGYARRLVPLRRRRSRPGRQCVGTGEDRRAPRRCRHVPHDPPRGRARGNPVGIATPWREELLVEITRTDPGPAPASSNF